MPFQKGRAGQYHPRKSFAVGGRERVRLSAWRVTLSDAIELELSGRFSSRGHVRLTAIDYMRASGRPGRSVTSLERIRGTEAVTLPRSGEAVEASPRQISA